MKFRNRSRWSDNDRYFGPFTYARDTSGYRPLAIVLQSRGDDDDESGDCTLRISGFGHTLITTLPPVVPPYRTKVHAKSWDDATVARMGRDWYWAVDKREFGFNLTHDGDWSPWFLSVNFGRQTYDSSTTKHWGWFVPWTDHRVVRHDHYDDRGLLCYSEPCPGPRWNTPEHEANEAALAAVPTVRFLFKDYDGEQLTCTTRITEMEWRKGSGRFKWVGRFYPSLIKRTLDLRFSGETGKRKGSWKGGTIGTAIVMLPGELHEDAFRRYCAENRMTFVDVAVSPIATEVDHG